MNEFEETLYQVYIKIDSNNNIISINSSIFLDDLTDWILIDEGNGDKYAHAQGNYFDKPIITDEGIYRYKYIDGQVIEKTQAEIDEEIAGLPQPEPTAQEDLMALMLDHEVRLTMLELGV